MFHMHSRINSHTHRRTHPRRAYWTALIALLTFAGLVWTGLQSGVQAQDKEGGLPNDNDPKPTAPPPSELHWQTTNGLKMPLEDFISLRDFIQTSAASAGFGNGDNTSSDHLFTRGGLSAAEARLPHTDDADSLLTAGARGVGVTPETARTPSYAALHLEFDTNANAARFNVPGTKTFLRFQKWVDVWVPAKVDTIQAVHDAPGLRWMEVDATGVEPPPPVGGLAPRSKGGADKIVSGGYRGLTGKGVIIAVVDTGVDFRHPDFITYDAAGRPTSRLLAFWDTTARPRAGFGHAAPLSYPNGASVGALYTRDELTAELRSPRPHLNSWDTEGHGTACAGIAAGNGNASGGRHAGVAPQADIIAVRVSSSDSVENSYLLGAICAWIDGVAGKRPAVISCSFGGQYGGHDGQTVLERQLSARFPPTLRGRALCIAAGNEGGDSFHSHVALDAVTSDSGTDSGTRQISWKASGQSLLSIYTKVSELQDLRLAGTEGIQVLPAYTNVLNGEAVLTLVVDGPGAIELSSRDGKALRADCYISGRAAFSDDDATPSNTVGQPGSTINAITVGSYDWNDTIEQDGKPVSVTQATLRGYLKPLQIGGLSNYSSQGPLRSGITKPDIVSPGQFFIAPYAANTVDVTATKRGFVRERDSTGFYRYFNGTSAATPYTAGVIALLFQKKPTLSVGEIKELLVRYATHDGNTGAVPNGRWGHGKLDTIAIGKMLSALGVNPLPVKPSGAQR